MPNVVPGYSTKMYYAINIGAVILTILYVIFLCVRGVQEWENPPTKLVSHTNSNGLPLPAFMTCPWESGVTYVSDADWGCSIFNQATGDFRTCSTKAVESPYGEGFAQCWKFNHGETADDGTFNGGHDLAVLKKGETLELFMEVTATNMSEVVTLAAEIGMYNQTYYGGVFADYFYANFDTLTVGAISYNFYKPLDFDAEVTGDTLETDEFGFVTSETKSLLEYNYNMATTSVKENVPKDSFNAGYSSVYARIKAASFIVAETSEFTTFGFFSVVSAVGGFWSIIGGVIGFLFVATYTPPTRFRLDKSAAVEEHAAQAKGNQVAPAATEVPTKVA